MNIVVAIKLVPDLVEELAIDETGTALDATFLRLIINELDNHAIEQAILSKEHSGGQVTIVAPDVEGADDVLYAAAARGADRLIKLAGDWGGVNNHAMAHALAAVLKTAQPQLVLTGVQAHNDLDGAVGPQLAELLDMPYIGYVSGVSLSGDKAMVRKEYPGGLIAQVEVTLPAVLGIQAAEKPPRYVPISKVRQVMKTTKIEEQPAAELESIGGATVSRMFRPEAGERAIMLEGEVDEVAAKLVAIFKEHGVL